MSFFCRPDQCTPGASGNIHTLHSPFESPSGQNIFYLKNFDTFARTSVRVSKMNAVAHAQLTFQMLTLLQNTSQTTQRISSSSFNGSSTSVKINAKFWLQHKLGCESSVLIVLFYLDFSYFALLCLTLCFICFLACLVLSRSPSRVRQVLCVWD